MTKVLNIFECFLAVFHSKVLATDYDTWAIEYTCHETLQFERFMLRSRTQTLPQAVRTVLHNIINGYGTNVSEFFVVSHHEFC